jgi:hypothetical protein
LEGRKLGKEGGNRSTSRDLLKRVEAGGTSKVKFAMLKPALFLIPNPQSLIPEL